MKIQENGSLTHTTVTRLRMLGAGAIVPKIMMMRLWLFARVQLEDVDTNIHR